MSTSTYVTAAPCAKCPFRRDVPIYLRVGRRREIARVLGDDGVFACHAEVDYDVDDEPDDTNARHCAGAAVAMLLDGASTNMLRGLDRLGALDVEQLVERHGEIVWSLSQWQTLDEGATGDDPRTLDDDDEIETCNTVGESCIAPAGYLGSGGGISYGTEPADGECESCGEPCCSECLDDDGRCGYCHEDE